KSTRLGKSRSKKSNLRRKSNKHNDIQQRPISGAMETTKECCCNLIPEKTQPNQQIENVKTARTTKNTFINTAILKIRLVMANVVDFLREKFQQMKMVFR